MILNFHAWLKLHIQNMNMHCVANLLVSSLGRLLVTSLRAYRQNSKSYISGQSIRPQTHPSIRASDKLTSLKNLFPCCVTQWGLQVKTRLTLSFFFLKVLWTEQRPACTILIHKTQHQYESRSEPKSMSQVLLHFLQQLTWGRVFLGQASDSHYVSINRAGLRKPVLQESTYAHILRLNSSKWMNTDGP